jgi:two-component system OmpR family response regulator
MMMVTQAAEGSRSGAPDRPARILVVDDEPSLAELLTMTLSHEGWEVRTAGDGAAALRGAAEFAPDAVLLDVGLPDFDGLEVLRRLRGAHPDLPVLFLTARDSAEDRAAGLLAGADGYLTKPFSLEHVVARLQSLLRAAGTADESVLTVGDLELSTERRTVRRGGEPVTLTTTEFAVLQHLMRHPGRVVTEDEIRAQVWGGTFGAQSRVVALCVTYLRRKIDAGREPLIHTAGDSGYVLGPAGQALGPAGQALGPAGQVELD